MIGQKQGILKALRDKFCEHFLGNVCFLIPHAYIFLTKRGFILSYTTPYTEPVTFPAITSENPNFSLVDDSLYLGYKLKLGTGPWPCVQLSQKQITNMS